MSEAIDRPFIVTPAGIDDDYVQSIDSYDGCVDKTSRRDHARVFWGDGWREFWDSPRWTIHEIESTNPPPGEE